MVVDGVQGKVDALFESLCTVFCPHLASLRLGIDEVETEMFRLEGLNYQRFFKPLAFVPTHARPQGGAQRKYEKRIRRVSDGAALRKLYYNRTDLSFNRAVGLKSYDEDKGPPTVKAQRSGPPRADEIVHVPDDSIEAALAVAAQLPEDTVVRYRGQLARTIGNRKWAREIKPAITDVLHDGVILHQAAQIFGEPIIDMTCSTSWAFIPACSGYVHTFGGQTTSATRLTTRTCREGLTSSTPRNRDSASGTRSPRT